MRPTGFYIPQQNEITEKGGPLTQIWLGFFRALFDRTSHVSTEQEFFFQNNNSVATDITGLQFDSNKVTLVYIDYLIQRISKGGSGAELVEAGTLRLVYKPKAGTWNITKFAGSGPDVGGITFSITAAGQVQYVSTNMAGTIDSTTPQKMTFRTRTMSGLVVKPGGGWA